jgi:hypothetical protein
MKINLLINMVNLFFLNKTLAVVDLNSSFLEIEK